MARINSKLETILPKIVTQLVTASGIATEYVYLSLTEGDDQADFPPTDKFLVIQPRGPFPMDQGAFAGGGSLTPLFTGNVKVTLWVRCYVDQPYRDDKLLTDATLGALATWSLILKGIINPSGTNPPGNPFDPVDGTDQILAEPCRILSFDIRPKANRDGWASVSLTLEIKWNQSVV